jgi:hypothetical protein
MTHHTPPSALVEDLRGSPQRSCLARASARGIANTKGHTGLLGHGTLVEFRNIRIRVL